MYTTEIIEILTWPALIIVSYQTIKFSLKIFGKKLENQKEE